jgi:CRISPR-associated endonuclease/helicase Cas3
MGMMDPKRLWAKSKPWDMPATESMYLLGHLRDVYHAAEKIVDATGEAQLRALGLEPEKYLARFRQCVLLAAAVHDLGKANDHFQGMICRSPDRQDKQQAVRHEWITILMLQELREWLRPAVANDTDWHIVEWAVSGHHPAHNHPSPPKESPKEGGCGSTIQLLMGHSDFTGIASWLQETFGGCIPKLTNVTRPLLNAHSVFVSLAAWSLSAQKLWQKKLEFTDDSRLLAAVKDCLVAADIAGSALAKERPDDPNRWDWITQVFSSIPSSSDLQFLADYGLDGKEPREFQATVSEASDAVVYVKAGCGTGKTVAAYLRAAKQWQGRRLYFCYPTTGTATEGFKDYLHPEYPLKPEDDSPKNRAERERLKLINADLFHSRSHVDYEIVLTTGADTSNANADVASRMESLAAWATPVVACTVDTVLGIIQNNKRGLFGWPALAQSAFVFDEIHAYDDRLFGALIRFLRDTPGLPCLLMTASLPTPREVKLREVLKKYRKIDLKPIEGPEEIEIMPRYHKIPDDGKHLDVIADEVKRGGKVLWVSNTVKRVMAAADAATTIGLEPKIYHSRYKYVDRVKRHTAVTNAFKKDHDRGVLACTSQVCEMSLDLEGCTLLVTESAPVPALIQRLGRLNRHAKLGDVTRPFVVLTLESQDHMPYTKTDLNAAAVWLVKLPDTDISQRHLADAWEQTAANPPETIESAWLDGGPITAVKELRDGSPGITVLLRSDVQHCHNSKELGKYTLPMPDPKPLPWHDWPKHKGIPIAEDRFIDYHEMRGAEWRKQ